MNEKTKEQIVALARQYRKGCITWQEAIEQAAIYGWTEQEFEQLLTS